jgi:hypothetical protein
MDSTMSYLNIILSSYNIHIFKFPNLRIGNLVHFTAEK